MSSDKDQIYYVCYFMKIKKMLTLKFIYRIDKYVPNIKYLGSLWKTDAEWNWFTKECDFLLYLNIL